MPWAIEVTDTFGGEANYSWVRRYSMPDVPKKEYGSRQEQALIVRRAKALAGWSGRTVTESYGDSFTVRPRGGECVVMFINWIDDMPEAEE